MRSLIFKTRYLFFLSALLLQVACSGGSDSKTVSTSDTFTLSGTISIDTRAYIDDDVMSTGGLLEQNNQIDTAQFLSNPVTLGGYLSGNQGTYSTDNNSAKNYDKDVKDFFSVTLIKGQQVRVTTFLANEDLTAVNVSVTLHAAGDALNEPETPPLIFNSASSQEITAPNDGEYTIELSAEEDLSSPVLYILSISQILSTSSAASKNSPRENAQFVPGEIVIKFKEANLAKALQSDHLQTKRSAISRLENKHQLLHNRSIGNLGSIYKINANAAQKTLAFEANLTGTPQAAELNLKWQTLNAIEQLNADSDVLFAEPNYIFKASAVHAKVNDPSFSLQWNLSMIDAPAAWEASTGEGVTVAVIDTGIDTKHLDLINNINFTDGYDFIVDAASADDEDPGSDNNPQDTGAFFHGSHVAGIIAAQGNNNIGVAGVAYKTTIMPLRALGVENTGTNSDIASAILYAAGLPNASGLTPTKKADIINLSLGATAIPALIKDAIDKALAQGIIIVAAAGNERSTVPHYPAAFEGVVAVSSVNERKILSNFSNHGAHIDVTAPGGTSVSNVLFDGFQDGILSTLYANEYAEYTGTSMSTPHVAGVAALMKSINQNLNTNSFEDALNNGELTDNLMAPDFYGNGLINAAKSVNWALASQGQRILPASLSIYPTKLGFVDANTAASLMLRNPGTGSVIVDLSTANDWIEINKSNANNATGLGEYPIKVNNTGLAVNSINRGEITVQYTINGVDEDPITIDVFNSNNQLTVSTVGTLWVSLLHIDENSPEKPLVQFALVEARKGTNQYTYNLNNIPKGAYILQAGTNNDSDLEIIDAGEARGQYPLFAQPEFIQVNNKNMSDLDFSVQFQSFVQATSGTTSSNTPATSANKSIGTAAKFR